MKKILRFIVIALLISTCLACFAMNTYAVRQEYEYVPQGFQGNTTLIIPRGEDQQIVIGNGGYIITAPNGNSMTQGNNQQVTIGSGQFLIGGHQVYNPGAFANGSGSQSTVGVRSTNPLDLIYGRGLNIGNE